MVGPDVGQRRALKLVNNMMVGATLVATCEAIPFSVLSGLSPRIFLDMISVSTDRSFTGERILNRR
jgi:3-hydroxyisobutyrate dehydrogenase-like beta-hydroxyacid dehydrogenase